MKRMKKIIPMFAAMAISTPALAQDMNVFYGSVGGGVYQIESQSFDDVAPSTRILGGYNFNKYVALETSYSRLFESSDTVDNTRVKIDGNVWDVGTRLSYPISTRISPYGRMGWSYVDLSAVVTDEGQRVRLNDYDNAFNWAVGAEYQLNKRIAVNGEYARSMIDDGDLDSVSMNLSYRFGVH